jgi:hypothetical protein
MTPTASRLSRSFRQRGDEVPDDAGQPILVVIGDPTIRKLVG